VFKAHDWDWTYRTIMVPMWGILSPTYPKPPNLTPAVLRLLGMNFCFVFLLFFYIVFVVFIFSIHFLLLGIVGRVYSKEQIVEVRSRIALVFTPYALQNCMSSLLFPIRPYLLFYSLILKNINFFPFYRCIQCASMCSTLTFRPMQRRHSNFGSL
jgi:hypothetical protein